MRQLANQARQLANDAQNVRQQLQKAGVPPKDLTPVDDVVKALRDLGDEKKLQNPTGLQELYQTAVQRFKTLEFEIRKRVDTLERTALPVRLGRRAALVQDAD